MTAPDSLRVADPVGVTGARRLTLAATGLVLAVALGGTIAGGRLLIAPWGATLALLLAAAAGAVLAIRSGDPRGIDARWGLLAAALAAGAHIADLLALGAAPTGQEWGPYVVALVALTLVPYRPVREIVALAVVLAAIVAAASGTAAALAGHPMGIEVVAAATPVLALPLGGAAFVHQVLTDVARWRASALDGVEGDVRRQGVAITRVVQQGRVTILNREVVPFYSSLSERGVLEEQDIERARELSSSIRGIMIADSSRSWLDDLLAPNPERAGRRRVVDDAGGFARMMSVDQRTALRALVGALRDVGVAALQPVSIRLDEGDGNCEGLLTAGLLASDRATRARLKPFLAVMGAVFSTFTYEFRSDKLTARFCFDRS